MTTRSYRSSRPLWFLPRSSWPRICRTWAILCLRFHQGRLRMERVAAAALAQARAVASARALDRVLVRDAEAVLVAAFSGLAVESQPRGLWIRLIRNIRKRP